MLSWALSWFSTFKPSATNCKETIQNEPKPRIKVLSKMEIKGRYTLTPEQLFDLTMHQLPKTDSTPIV
jgi:hypothetical protein